MANKDKVAETDPSHWLFVTEPAEQPAKSGEPIQPNPGRLRQKNAYSYLKPVADTPAEGSGRRFDDPIDL
jgi:hypothetical protein